MGVGHHPQNIVRRLISPTPPARSLLILARVHLRPREQESGQRAPFFGRWRAFTCGDLGEDIGPDDVLVRLTERVFDSSYKLLPEICVHLLHIQMPVVSIGRGQVWSGKE